MNRTQFKESFEVDEDSGAWLYKTDACMNRHQGMDRRDELSNDRAVLSGVEMAKERNLWACAYVVAEKLGIRPTTEDLEEFVQEHMAKVSNE